VEKVGEERGKLRGAKVDEVVIPAAITLLESKEGEGGGEGGGEEEEEEEGERKGERKREVGN